MKKSSKAWLISFISFALVIMLLSVPFYTAFAAQSSGTTYYVSASGSDENNGTTENTPFKTIEKVNSLSLSTGDEVCFKRGDLWRGDRLLSHDDLLATADAGISEGKTDRLRPSGPAAVLLCQVGAVYQSGGGCLGHWF